MRYKYIIIIFLFLLISITVIIGVFPLSENNDNWHRAFGTKSRNERACSITFTHPDDMEKGYLAAGYTMRGIDQNTSNGYLVKIKPSGDIYWEESLPVNKIKFYCSLIAILNIFK